MTTEIWHNPKCSKSRETLKLLQERGLSPTVRLYLVDAPSADEIERVLSLLGAGAPWDPRALMRKGEDEYAALGLDDPKKTRRQLVEAMAANPRLIERPVVVHGGRAALGRPPDNVLSLFS